MIKTDLSEGIAKKSNRFLSVDTLRGFDMLLISGGGTFIVLMEGKTNWPWIDAIARQLEHPEWIGFTFYDFIFPLFLFISGVSIAFSLNRDLRNGVENAVMYRKAFRRMIVLIILGMIDKNVPFTFFEPANIRLGSVLGRIGMAGFIATILYLNFSWKSLLIWIGGIQSLLNTIKQKWGKVAVIAVGIGIFLVTVSFQAGNSVGVGIALGDARGTPLLDWIIFFNLLVISLIFFKNSTRFWRN